jgi:hypothetical protein
MQTVMEESCISIPRRECFEYTRIVCDRDHTAKINFLSDK